MTKKDLTDAAYVRGHFEALCNYLGVTEPAVVESEWAAIETAYAEPHRAYHTMAHIASLLRTAESFYVAEADMPRMRAFIIYHDFYYETADMALFAQNENRSADRAARFLKAAGADDVFTASVHSLIVATRTHKVDNAIDPVGALAIDIDMMILASPQAEYDAYAKGIRREFAHFSDDAFYTARLEKFLEPVLESERLFMTPRVHTYFTAQARSNIRREAGNIKLRFAGLKPL